MYFAYLKNTKDELTSELESIKTLYTDGLITKKEYSKWQLQVLRYALRKHIINWSEFVNLREIYDCKSNPNIKFKFGKGWQKQFLTKKARVIN